MWPHLGFYHDAFDRTYEGLKPHGQEKDVVARKPFDRTYEGLKRVLLCLECLFLLLLTVPMRV